MNVRTLLDNFDLIADAPGGVPKLRDLILHFAFTGQLLSKTTTWQTKPLKSVATKIGSGSTPDGGRTSYVAEGIPLIRSMNVHFRGFVDDGLVYLTDEQADGLANVIVQPDDVLLNITGASIGRVTTAPRHMSGARVNQHVTIIRPTPELDPFYLAKFLASPAVQYMINDIQVGATRQALTKAKIEQFEIPLPPLPEQKRIVAKVDELMKRCDELETRQKERAAHHKTLVASCLNALSDPKKADALFTLHSSLVTLDSLSFNLLFTSPESVAELRKTILQLAVQGRLVLRKVNESSGMETLKEIGLCVENISDIPPLPSHWTWVRLGDIITRMDSGWSPACLAEPADEKTWGVLKTTAVQTLQYQEHQNKTLPSNLAPRPEHEVMDGDILFTRAGPMNRVGIVCVARPTRKKLMISDKIIRFHPVMPIDPDFAALALNSSYSSVVIKTLKSGMAESQVNISQPKLKMVPIPVPPLAEQKRILAKVNELMSMCDSLEAKLTQSSAVAEKLAGAVVNHMSL